MIKPHVFPMHNTIPPQRLQITQGLTLAGNADLSTRVAKCFKDHYAKSHTVHLAMYVENSSCFLCCLLCSALSLV